MTAPHPTAPPPEDRIAQALEVLEGATALLRTATAIDYFYYCLGTLPFLWQLVRFWAQMSLSANAERELLPSATLLALTYLWMKVGQTLFVQRLLGVLRDAPAHWTTRQLLRIAWSTVILQSSALFVSLCAAVLLIPTGWTIAFYHHAQATCDGTEKGIRASLREALAQSQFWPRENHALITLHAAFALVVFLDVWVLLVVVPQQLFTLFGLETFILTLGHSPFNTTLIVAAATITMALTDPWLKAAYAVRAFRAESVTTGYDLRVAWRKSWLNVVASVLLGLGLLLAPRTSFAQTEESPSSELAPKSEPQLDTDAQRLDRSLNEVLRRDAFAWRAPRDTSDDRQADSWLKRWMREAGEAVGRWLRRLGETLGKFIAWLLDLRGPSTSDDPSNPIDWGRVLSRGAVILAILIWGIPLVIVLRQWRRQRVQSPPAPTPEVATEEPQCEGLEAAKQPSSEWQRQAEQWLASGERRLAIRALFLGNLAYLFEVGQLAALAHKTVGDYRRDLGRRAHVHPNSYAGYCSTALIFESSWYGSHQVTDEVLEQFSVGSAALRQNV